MAKIVTTSALIAALQKADPSGNLPVLLEYDGGYSTLSQHLQYPFVHIKTRDELRNHLCVDALLHDGDRFITIE